ncbi:MAG: hypothetical protein DMF06_05920 [Verrucomicrobia bacterium]|nr:MAG: hypothetical protein DMF06_05920 [Verrucomicrobiota bacterium]
MNVDQRDNQLAAEIEAFKNAIGAYASRLAVSPDQVAGQAADAEYFRYALAVQELRQKQQAMEQLENASAGRWKCARRRRLTGACLPRGAAGRLAGNRIPLPSVR